MTTQHASTTSTDVRDGPFRVGFVGLGDQGGAIAERICRGGFALDVWARRPASAEPLVQLGAAARPSAAELGRRCDVVAICVVDDAGVDDVVVTSGLLAAMAPGSTLVVHSTVAPETCRRLARLAAPNGVDVLDAPVSGGRTRALRGELSVMVGGDAAAFARAGPVFATFGNPVRHVGPIGTAQAVKLINNALFVANAGLAGEALDFGERLGLDRALLLELLAASSGRSAALDALPALTGTDWGLAAWDVLAKDVRLGAALVEELGADRSALIAAACSTIEKQRGTR